MNKLSIAIAPVIGFLLVVAAYWIGGFNFERGPVAIECFIEALFVAGVATCIVELMLAA